MYQSLATKPLAELLPRFLPGSDELAAGLTGGRRPLTSTLRYSGAAGWAARASRATIAGVSSGVGRTSIASVSARPDAALVSG